MYKNRYNSKFCEKKYNNSLKNCKRRKMLKIINKKRIKYRLKL